MAKFTPGAIRDLALVGHGGSGKTTLTESFLFNSGAIGRMGSVDDGSCKTDYDPEEVARKISINSVPATIEWGSAQITAFDSPGFADFTPEVKSVLHNLDGVLLVLNAGGGVEAQASRYWHYCRSNALPVMCVVNKLDKENADFSKVLSQLGEELDGSFFPVALPIGAEDDLKGVVDLISRKAYIYDPDKGTCSEGEIPADLAADVDSYRETLVEDGATSADESLMEKYLEEGELSEDEIRQGLRAAVLEGTAVPVFPTSATRHVGIRHLLDGIVSYMPSPADRPAKAKKGEEEVEIQAGEGPAAAQVMKVLTEAHVGEISIVRVYRGELKSAATLLNSSQGEREKLGTIYRIKGKEREEVPSLSAGEIGGLVKLKATGVGDTLTDEKDAVLFPRFEASPALMSVSIHPQTNADLEKLGNALMQLRSEDPFIRTEMNEATREFVVHGSGELHIQIFTNRLKSRFGVNVDVDKPKIAYKETIRGKAEGQGKHKKQSGGRGQYGDCWLRLEPKPDGGFEFENAIVGGVIPGKFIPAVEKGVKEAMARGVVAGYPVTDVKVTVYDGSTHSVDSSEVAYKTAASKGFKKIFREAKPVLLEPIMHVEILAPEANMGDIMGDINSRRGKILGMEPMGRQQLIKAQVPLAEMHSYVITLRSITGGRGEFTMREDHYAEVPHQAAEDIIKAYKGEDDED